MHAATFTDSQQDEYMQWFDYLNKKIHDGFSDYDHFDKVIAPKFNELCLKKDGILRMCQAIITDMGIVAEKKPDFYDDPALSTPQEHVIQDKLDVLAGWMIWFLQLLFNLKQTLPAVTEIGDLVARYVRKTNKHDCTMKPYNGEDYRIANLGVLLSILANLYQPSDLESLLSDNLLIFLIDVVIQNSNKYSQLFALTALERFSCVDSIKQLWVNNESLKNALLLKRSSVQEFKLGDFYNRGNEYYLRFQIGACARWLLDRVFGNVDEEEEREALADEPEIPKVTSPVKLRTTNASPHDLKVTTNNLSAYGCFYNWQDYQSTVPVANVASGQVYFFEAILLTSGSIRVGWAVELPKDGFDFYGFAEVFEKPIGFDAYEKRIFAPDYTENLQNVKPVRPGDVVGCLLNTNRKGFTFYLNGEVVKQKGPTEGLDLADQYYPTVSLSAFQQIYFNFGQDPFRYPPPGFAQEIKPVKSVDEADDGNLSDTDSEEYLSTVSHSPDDHGEKAKRVTFNLAPFNDDIQGKVEKWIIELESKVWETRKFDYLRGQFKSQLNMLIVNKDNDWLRLAQAMIDEMGIISEDNIDVLANWIVFYVNGLMSRSVSAPTPDRILALIKPYIQLCFLRKRPKSRSFNRFRNVCILLSMMPHIYQDETLVSKLLTSEVLDFLLYLVTKNIFYKSTKLYALIAMQSLAMSPLLKVFLSSNFHLRKSLKFLSSRSNRFVCKLNHVYNPIAFQTSLLAGWLLDHVFDDASYVVNTHLAMRISKDRYGLAKAYRDGLSPIGCFLGYFEFQSTVDVQPGFGMSQYYEVVVLTSGSIRVGWAHSNDRSDVDPMEGMLNMPNSVFFDPYEKIIFINGKPRHFARLRDVHPGDIIACELDTVSNTFSFHINGYNFFERTIKFDDEPMFATVALSAFQQVYLNFGQAKFVFN